MISPLKVLVVLVSFTFLSSFATAQKAKKPVDSGIYGELPEATRIAAIESYEDGLKFSLLENYEKAAEKYQLSLSYFPFNAAALYKLAEAEVKQNKLEDALKHCEQILSIREDNKYYLAQLASIYAALNKYELAANTYLKIVDNIPHTNEYLEMAADMQVRAGNFKDALKTLAKIEKVFGVTESSTRNKINLYLRNNKLNDALKAARALIEANPDIPQYRLIVAELYLANSRNKEAEEEIRLIVDRYKLKVAYLMLYDLYSMEGKKAAADSLLDEPFKDSEVDIDQKIRILSMYLKGFASPEESKRVIELAAMLVKAHPTDPKSWAIQGDFLNLANQREKARASYLQSTLIKSNFQQVWEQIVLIDSQLEQPDSLLKHTNTAVELFPNNGTMWFYNGRALMVAKEYTKAVSALEQVKRLVSDNPALLLESNALLGDAYNKTKDFKKSDQCFEAALSKDPDNAYLLNNYAYYLSERNDNMSRAKELGDKLIKKEPDNANYLDTYGWILYRMKDYADARKYLEKAVEKGNSGVVSEHLGDVLFKLGEKDKAIQSWKKAKELGGDTSPMLDKKIASKILLNE